VLVANSEATRGPVVRWLGEDAVIVVPNGLAIATFERVGPPMGRTPVVVGMVANLTSRWKRHDLFVEAAGRVGADAPARYVLAGRDPVSEGGRDDYAELLHRRVHELGLDERFEFAGFVPDGPELMARLDVLVHPCAHESFGRVALEAMAAGRPVVGVDGGGIASIVVPGETGTLVADDDAEALARAIREVVADEEQRVRWGAAGRERARRRYSLEATVSGVLSAYATARSRRATGRTGD
jgi:glycosyltransferase involved in cell wall biosynthesis